MQTTSDASAKPTTQSGLQFNSQWIPGGELVPAIEQTAAFYKAVFGLAETRRYGSGQRNELGISLNFGSSPEEARRQSGPDFGIAATAPSAPADDFVRAALHPRDLATAVERVVEHGAELVTAPSGSDPDTVFFRDPAGNLIELSPLPAALATTAQTQVEWRISARDLDAAVKFYETVFGLKQVARAEHSSAAKVSLQFEASTPAPVRLSILRVGTDPTVRMTHHASQTVFTALSEEAFKATLERAQAQSSELVLKPVFIESVAATFARVRDPARNIVELVWRKNAVRT